MNFFYQVILVIYSFMMLFLLVFYSNVENTISRIYRGLLCSFVVTTSTMYIFGIQFNIISFLILFLLIYLFYSIIKIEEEQ